MLDTGATSPEVTLLVLCLGLLTVSVASAIAPVGRLNPRSGSAVLAAISSAGFTVVGLAAIGLGTPVSWSAATVLGLPLIHVSYDALGGLLLAALGIVGTASSVFAIGYQRAKPHDLTEAAYPIFLVSLALVFGADDAFAFLFAWELMALSSAALVVGSRPSAAVARAGYVYLSLTHLATAALVLAFAILVAAAGSTSFADLAAGAATMPPIGRDLVFVLIVIGFGTKAGAIPFHVWLPRAHPVAPSHVSAVMSGVMIKAGIYGLVRFAFDILGPGSEWWGLAVLVIGVASAILGVLYALMEHDLKRLLAFHSIENVGIILIGVGIALMASSAGLGPLAVLALTGALFHTLNHALFKSLLFLAAGSIQRAAGSRDLNVLGGLARAMPVTALAFGIGAAAISGLPPLNGFASEWLTFAGLFGAGSDAFVSPVGRAASLLAIGGLGLTAALAVACFVKATGMAFLGLPRADGAATASESPTSMRAAMVFLATACVAAGLFAGPVSVAIAGSAAIALGTNAASSAAMEVPVAGFGAVFAALPVAALVAAIAVGSWLVAERGRRRRRVPTWTCGIAPEPRFAYTATSYGKLIRLYYGPILRPVHEVAVEHHPGTPFPRTVRYRGDVRHLIDERLYGPLHRAAVSVAQLARRFQSGSLQHYLAYTVAALVVLLLVAR